MAFQNMQIVTLSEAQERMNISNIRWYKMQADRGKCKESFPSEVAIMGKTRIYAMEDIVQWYNRNVRSRRRYDNLKVDISSWDD